MARELRLPELAESVVEGEIVRWLVEEGDSVVLDQPVVEVMTDKVTVELPSPYAGKLLEKLVGEGDVVAVNAVIARFDGEGADSGAVAPEPGTGSAAPGSAAPSLQAAEERSIVETGANVAEDDGESLSLFKPSGGAEEPLIQIRRPGGSAPGTTAPVSARSAPAATPAAPANPAARGLYGRVLAVPAARKLARELGVDIEHVEGSGPNGRIRIDDVRQHVEGGSFAGANDHAFAMANAGASGGASASAAGYSATPYVPGEQREERIAVRGLRRVIANQMKVSHLETVRTLHVDEADVTELVALRNKLRPRAEARGVKLSYLPFIMKAVVAGLQRFPMINATLDTEANEIVRKYYYNIGMAVATEAGLVVPVVHGVDTRSILDIAADINRLAELARVGKLAAEDIKGGTFSVTNIGSLGGLFSFPIINVPEAAILGVHSIKKRPVVLADDSIVARQMLYLSLSFDHRLIDGAEGAMFTGYVIDLLQNPEALMLDL